MKLQLLLDNMTNSDLDKTSLNRIWNRILVYRSAHLDPNSSSIILSSFSSRSNRISNRFSRREKISLHLNRFLKTSLNQILQFLSMQEITGQISLSTRNLSTQNNQINQFLLLILEMSSLYLLNNQDKQYIPNPPDLSNLI